MKALELRTSLFKFDATQLGQAYRVVIGPSISTRGKRFRGWLKATSGPAYDRIGGDACRSFPGPRKGGPIPQKGSSRTLGKSELTVREAGKLAVAKHTLHLSLLSPCILLILPRSGQAMTSLPAVHPPTTPF